MLSYPPPTDPKVLKSRVGFFFSFFSVIHRPILMKLTNFLCIKHNTSDLWNFRRFLPVNLPVPKAQSTCFQIKWPSHAVHWLPALYVCQRLQFDVHVFKSNGHSHVACWALHAIWMNLLCQSQRKVQQKCLRYFYSEAKFLADRYTN